MKRLSAILLAAVLVSGCDSDDKAGEALRQAMAYGKAGQFEAALQKHIWFHDHALQVDRSYYGVRLSVALDDWVELGKKYPKALESLREIRDKKASLLAGGDTSPELFHDVGAINERLGESHATVALFKQIESCDPAFGKTLYEAAEEPLIAAGEYALARKYLGDAEERFKEAKRFYERGPGSATKRNGQQADMTRSITQDLFTERVVRLIRVLSHTGDQGRAREIQAEALRLLDSDKIKNALVR